MASIWYGVDPYNNMFLFQTSFSYWNANPIRFIDPMGLFPTRKDAKHYKIEHNINGRIQKNKDGQFDINDYNNHVSYTAGNDNFGPSFDTHPNDGVIESVMITKGITGKSIGDHVDQFVEEKFNTDAGSIVNW